MIYQSIKLYSFYFSNSSSSENPRCKFCPGGAFDPHPFNCSDPLLITPMTISCHTLYHYLICTFFPPTSSSFKANLKNGREEKRDQIWSKRLSYLSVIFSEKSFSRHSIFCGIDLHAGLNREWDMSRICPLTYFW